MPKVFISYARNDDEPFVKQLYEDLTKKNFRRWWDRKSMESRGRSFLQEIRDAIENADRLVAVIGPNAVASDYVLSEWEHALLFCKSVVPILRQGDYNLIPENFSKFHCLDFRPNRPYKNALEEIVRILCETVPVLGPFLTMVPSLPPHFLPRSKEITEIGDVILADVQRPMVITSFNQATAIQGMGGTGKSVIAAALARTADTRKAFTDGIIWLTMGQELNLLQKLKSIGTAFEDDPGDYIDLDSAKARLPRLLADKVCLFILDDVWYIEHVESVVNSLGPRCRLLITTRDGTLVTSLGAQEHRLDVLSELDALKLLADWCSTEWESLPPEAISVAQKCGFLPFALALCGALFCDGVPWPDLLSALQEADIEFIKKQLPNYPYPDVFKSLKVSITHLNYKDSASAQRYKELAVFPKNEAVPEGVVCTFWSHTSGMREREARKLLRTLERKALLRIGGKTPDYRVYLHDLQHDYLKAMIGEAISILHKQLLIGYLKCAPNGLWHMLIDDDYIHSHLTWHMELSGQTEQIYTLLNEETTDGHNGWYSIRESQGDTAGYINDLLKAWNLLDNKSCKQLGVELSGVECRYALILSSISSLADKIPPKLLEVLVEKGVWSSVHALAYARRESDAQSRMLSLLLLVSHLPESLQEQVLHEALMATQKIDRREVWGGFDFSIRHKYQAQALCLLAPHLKKSNFTEALSAAHNIEDTDSRIEALTALLPYLPESLKEKTIEEVLSLIPGPDFWFPRVKALASSIPHLPEPLSKKTLEEVFALVRKNPDRNQVEALTALLSYLPESIREKTLEETFPHVPNSMMGERPSQST